jgi:tRNA synthetases class I (M)
VVVFDGYCRSKTILYYHSHLLPKLRFGIYVRSLERTITPPFKDPHIGHLYSTVIADILARYALIQKPSRPVVFVTGTDEHGSKIQKAAHDQGMSGREQEFCDKLSQRFRVSTVHDL